MVARRIRIGSAVAAATTWNPSDKSANITLSNSDRTATFTSTTNGGVRSVAAVAGKKYFEVRYDVGTTSARVGIANLSHTLATQLGSDVDSAGVKSNDGDVLTNGSGVSTGAAFTAADVACIAVDRDNNKLWYRKNGGAWMNGVGSADPATNTGGLDISGVTGAIYAAFDNFIDTDAATARFSSSDWTQTAPTGFTQIT